MRSLATKLILGFLVVSLTGALLVVVFARRATVSEFGQFVFDQGRDDLTAQLAEYYSAYGTWEGVEDVLRFSRPGAGGRRPGMPPFGPETPAGGGRGLEPPFSPRGPIAGGYALADARGAVVLAGMGFVRGEQLASQQLSGGQTIEVDGATVGTLLTARGPLESFSRAGADFLARINRALALALAGAMAVALVLGVVLSRTIARPVRELTEATRAVAAGDLGHQVPVSSRDEIGRLATAFNNMSRDLARAQASRKRMTADIAHDLRTPLSVILGHAEALRDGVLPPTPENLNLVHDEALRLNRLVEDLRTLSQADAGELQLNRRAVSPAALLERAASAHAPRARQSDVSLHVDAPANLPNVDVDRDHMARVLGNLLDNALSHTPAGGAVRLEAALSPDGKGARMVVSDTGPGIAPEDLGSIFQRFYRADRSRYREGPSAGSGTNGSGLGLAISKSIVEAHGGRITARSQPGAGASFIIELPLA